MHRSTRATSASVRLYPHSSYSFSSSAHPGAQGSDCGFVVAVAAVAELVEVLRCHQRHPHSRWGYEECRGKKEKWARASPSRASEAVRSLISSPKSLSVISSKLSFSAPLIDSTSTPLELICSAHACVSCSLRELCCAQTTLA